MLYYTQVLEVRPQPSAPPFVTIVPQVYKALHSNSTLVLRPNMNPVGSSLTLETDFHRHREAT